MQRRRTRIGMFPDENDQSVARSAVSQTKSRANPLMSVRQPRKWVHPRMVRVKDSPDQIIAQGGFAQEGLKSKGAERTRVFEEQFPGLFLRDTAMATQGVRDGGGMVPQIFRPPENRRTIRIRNSASPQLVSVTSRFPRSFRVATGKLRGELLQNTCKPSVRPFLQYLES